MKSYITAVTVFIFIFALLFTGHSPGVYAAEAASMAEIKATALNVRTGPGIQHSIMNMISRGTYVTYLGRQGDWLKVRLPWGKVGWIFGGKGYTASHPIKETVRTTAPTLNVRSGPGVNHARIGQLPQGTKIPVLEIRDEWQRIVFDTGRTGWVSAALTQSPTAAASRGEERAAPPAATSSQGAPKTSALQGKTIVVDPGHGGHDPGAVGITLQLTEKFVNADTALRLARLLEGAGARVVLTRKTDVFISLGQRVAMARNAKADIFVSIHANAHTNRSIGGTETYYNSSYCPTDSRRLALLVQQELVTRLNLRDIGVKEGSFYVIRHTTMPSILLELAFLSNGREESLLNQADFRQKSAEATYRGILRYFQ